MEILLDQTPTYEFNYESALSINQMKRLDYYAVKKYHLPIELMMENAGYQLARLAASLLPPKSKIEIGIGVGNNGGGGLVAARRLAAWGYDVYLDIPHIRLNELPMEQANRAIAFGANIGRTEMPDLFIDAYFGFSQRLPLPNDFVDRIYEVNQYLCRRISLDIPTGLSEQESDEPFIFADMVCTLAAPKKLLNNPELTGQVYVADLGIPPKAYTDLGLANDLPFHDGGLVQLLM